jgi:predicted dienelactone hydrolase
MSCGSGTAALRLRRNIINGCLALLLMLVASAGLAADGPYDPLRLAAPTATVGFLDLTVHDAARSRDVPIRVFLPAAKSPQPVVLFSHGLGGSREGSAYLAEHWAGRGYVTVYLQHPGSDAAVWQDVKPARRTAAMRRAASADNLMLRVKDVSVVLDQLAAWNGSGGHALAGRLDLSRVGMSGHSFGAVTTQALSGELDARGGASLTDARIKAAIAFSPSAPRRGNAARAFGSVRIPWLLMTGTKDTAAIGGADVTSRLAVFPALPPGGKYELVLFNAEHSAFTDRALPGDREARNPNHHRVILAFSTAFWDAWLRGDAAAKVWLDGEAPRSLLESRDRWQRK